MRNESHNRLIFFLVRKGFNTLEKLTNESGFKKDTILTALYKLRDFGLVEFKYEGEGKLFHPILTPLMKRVYEEGEDLVIKRKIKKALIEERRKERRNEMKKQRRINAIYC